MPNLDRAKFYAGVRDEPFPKKLKPVTVTNIDTILDEFDKRANDGTIGADWNTALKYLAYILATRFAECGPDMAPVREGFSKSDKAAREYVKRKRYKYSAVVNGNVYYGRGGVQLTWLDNYDAMGKILGVDLVGNPDLALDPRISTLIQFEGMTRGTFTGKRLADYFAPGLADWKGARRIINRQDRATEIANIAKMFYADAVNATV